MTARAPLGRRKVVTENEHQHGPARDTRGSRKRLWLVPFLLVTLLLLAAVLLSQGPEIVPFLYSKF